MKKNLLIVLLMFFVLSNASFACCCKDSGSLVACKNQKACQTIFSFIAIDFSFLSPRATAADVHICAPNKCCMPQNPEPNCPQCCPCPPQNCVPTCPQCCPCAPQCSPCQKRSMKSSNNKQDEIIPVSDNKAITPISDKQITPLSTNEIIPISYNQIKTQSCADVKNKTSLFRIDLFRIFKVQIL